MFTVVYPVVFTATVRETSTVIVRVTFIVVEPVVVMATVWTVVDVVVTVLCIVADALSVLVWFAIVEVVPATANVTAAVPVTA